MVIGKYSVAIAGCLFAICSCARVQVDPIEVKPIHITMDINIKVDRELDDFFSFEKNTPARSPGATTTQNNAASRM